MVKKPFHPSNQTYITDIYLYSLSHTDSKYKTCQSVNRSRNLELTFFIMKKQAAQNQFIYTGRNNEIVQIVLQRNYP